MLKPKKKLTKKELKQDPFLEKVDKIETYFEHNKQKIVQIIIAALVLFFGYKFTLTTIIYPTIWKQILN